MTLLSFKGFTQSGIVSIQYKDNGLGILYQDGIPISGGIVPSGGQLFDYKTVRFLVCIINKQPTLFWTQDFQKPWKVVEFPTPDHCGEILKFSTQSFHTQGHDFNGGVQLKCSGEIKFYSFKVRMNGNNVPIRTSVFIFAKQVTEWYIDQPQ